MTPYRFGVRVTHVEEDDNAPILSVLDKSINLILKVYKVVLAGSFLSALVNGIVSVSYMFCSRKISLDLPEEKHVKYDRNQQGHATLTFI